MTSENAKKGLTVIAVVSVILGAMWSLTMYDNLLDPRTWNVIGLVFIVLVGLYAAFAAIVSCRGNRASSD